MHQLILEKVAKAISESFHEEGYMEGMSDPNEWNEFLKAGRLSILALKDLPDEYFTRVYDKIVWEGIINRIIERK